MAAESIAAGDLTGWSERLYAAAEAGQTVVPWDRGAPSRYLTEWAGALHGAGQRAVVAGCGLGDDAEFIAGLGFQTTAFDISPTAIAAAPPVCWLGGALPGRGPAQPASCLAACLRPGRGEPAPAGAPDPPRRDAIARLGDLVAPQGTLIVIARAREPGQRVQGPPWALTRAEVSAFADGGLEPVRIEDMHDPQMPWPRRWRAEFRRPARQQPIAAVPG
jgi:hypothetical protein